MDTLLGTARRGHPGLFWTAVAMTALAMAFLVLAVVDQRELVGAPLWFKPLKFAISIAAYTATLAWMLGRLPAPALQRTGWAMVAGLWIEILIIGGQAARGQLSHFNDDGGTGSLLFAVMGASITVVFFLNAAVAVRFLRERSIEADLAVAVRIGLLVTLVGMSLGFLLTTSGGHTVGLPDGGPGLPLVGWSTDGGDLRIGHFVGLHALQALPLLAGVLARFAPTLDAPTRARMLRVVGLGYLGLIALLTAQALRGQPLLAPDGLTLGLLALLVIGTGLGLRAANPRRAALTGSR
jgi:hypothetical protein